MWELDQKESWVPKNCCFWTVVLEKTLENPLDSKEIKPVNPKGNQPWIFIERTVAEAEAPYFGHLMQTADWKRPWCWERLKAIGEEGGRKLRWLDSTHTQKCGIWSSYNGPDRYYPEPCPSHKAYMQGIPCGSYRTSFHYNWLILALFWPSCETALEAKSGSRYAVLVWMEPMPHCLHKQAFTPQKEEHTN